MYKKVKQNGGDGYVVNVNEIIGGRPSFSRYSNNYRPIFEGELLQNGGDGYSVNVSKEDIGGRSVFTKYNDNSIFDIVKQYGGNNSNSKKNNISQFYAIKELSQILNPLSINSLVKLNSSIFLNNLSETKSKKSKQMGGYINEIQNILVPLGKNNLLVLAALLLLHHFAVGENNKINNKINNKKNKNDILKGGNNNLINKEISNILEPLGTTNSGLSVLYQTLEESFQKSTNNKIQKGGSILKDIIAPLGTNAFIATGLLIIIEKLFTAKMNEYKNKEKEKDTKKLIGGNIDKNFDKLFNLIAPITFNTFSKDFLLKKNNK